MTKFIEVHLNGVNYLINLAHVEEVKCDTDGSCTIYIGFEHCCLYGLTMRYNDFCSYGKREGGSD